jgi:hypothetical protein
MLALAKGLLYALHYGSVDHQVFRKFRRVSHLLLSGQPTFSIAYYFALTHRFHLFDIR